MFRCESNSNRAFVNFHGSKPRLEEDQVFQIFQFWSSRSRGKVTLEWGLQAHNISVSLEKFLDGVIRRSSVETSARA